MLEIRKMSPEDIGFAIKLTDTRGWELVEDDFKLALGLEPDGCFILEEDSEGIGLVTNVCFDGIGWLGNLIVDESHRKKGAGAQLVKHSIAYFKSKGAETVGIYAYQDVIEFYKKTGFTQDIEFVVQKGKPTYALPAGEPTRVRKQDLEKIVAFDHVYFGASREKLLKPILSSSDNLCYMHTEKGQIVGYGLASAYGDMAEIGPVIIRRERYDVAVDLLKALLNRLEGFEASICMPAKESRIIKFLASYGFMESFRVARMFYKPPTLKDCIYVAESLERG